MTDRNAEIIDDTNKALERIGCIVIECEGHFYVVSRTDLAAFLAEQGNTNIHFEEKP